VAAVMRASGDADGSAAGGGSLGFIS
jgi:hypothetical protein